MGKLSEFLRVQGIQLIEPILGGKRLDFHRIYSSVVANGGYEKVTADKHWFVHFLSSIQAQNRGAL